jgi:hypothetical protein
MSLVRVCSLRFTSVPRMLYHRKYCMQQCVISTSFEQVARSS